MLGKFKQVQAECDVYFKTSRGLQRDDSRRVELTNLPSWDLCYCTTVVRYRLTGKVSIHSMDHFIQSVSDDERDAGTSNWKLPCVNVNVCQSTCV